MNLEYTFYDVLSAEDVEKLHRLLNDTYWAKTRTLEDVHRSLEHSMIWSVRHAVDGLVGFGRAVSDKVTFTWICDVVVDPAHRAQGIGKAIVTRILAHEDIVPTRIALVTKDAHKMYEDFGFQPHDYDCMILHPTKAELKGNV